MIDAKGNHLELRRDPQRNLQEIKTPHGRWIKFNYDDLSRIKRAEDDAGHWAQYEYNSDGMLEAATLSSGRQWHYEYDGALMTRIINEKGRVLLRNWYKSGVLMRQQFENGAIYSYSYDWAPNRFYADKVVVTLPDQTKRDVSVQVQYRSTSRITIDRQRRPARESSFVSVQNSSPTESSS